VHRGCCPSEKFSCEPRANLPTCSDGGILGVDGGSCSEDKCGGVVVLVIDESCNDCPSGGSSCYGAPPPRLTVS